MTTEKYLNTYRMMKLPADEIRARLRNLDDSKEDRNEKRMKREALEMMLRRALIWIILIGSTLSYQAGQAQTVAKGEILNTEGVYYVEIHDYVDGRWQWVNWDRWDYGHYWFFVSKYDQMNWRVITCSDTTHYRIYGAPERTEIDTAVVHDGGFHTIGNNPNPIIE
jgi:hypothetical protein